MMNVDSTMPGCQQDFGSICAWGSMVACRLLGCDHHKSYCVLLRGRHETVQRPGFNSPPLLSQSSATGA